MLYNVVPRETKVQARRAPQSSSPASIWKLCKCINIFITEIKPNTQQQGRGKADPILPFQIPTLLHPCRELVVDSHQMTALEAGELTPLITVVRPFPLLPSSSPWG